MNFERFFPPHVRAALAYDPPGAWMPPAPPGCIRLHAGYPFPESVPARDMAQAAARVAAAEADLPFHYPGSPTGARLPTQLADLSRARGITPADGGLLVTSGSIQALDLAARALLDADTVIAVEAPTYMEALEVFRNYTPHIVSYPVDGAGLQVDVLAADLAERRAHGRALPRVLYTIPSFQNPTGTTLPPERRRRLLDLAREFDFLIIEDDAYGYLAFTAGPPPLKALDPSERVVYLGSLSKVIGPGLRVGWAVAPPPLVTAMDLFRKDLAHPFMHAVVARYLADTDMTARLNWLRQQYRARWQCLRTALERHMPAGVTWTEPQGGYFVWLHVPGIDTLTLLPDALAAGVSFVPGRYFHFRPDAGTGREYLRLSFSHVPPAAMTQGVERLAALLVRAQNTAP